MLILARFAVIRQYLACGVEGTSGAWGGEEEEGGQYEWESDQTEQ